MPEWTPEQIVAIKGSIEKWERIVDGTGEDANNCPLCKMHCSEGCGECPVVKCSGDYGCTDTPYDDWVDHLHNAHGVDLLVGNRKVHCPTCKELAQAELDFLREVLKEGSDA